MAPLVRMTPAKPRKSAKSRKSAGKAAKAMGRKASPAKAAKGKKAGKPAASATGHAHCAATDPFGDPCQNVPRRPSKYCVIHSYLDR